MLNNGIIGNFLFKRPLDKQPAAIPSEGSNPVPSRGDL